MKIIICLDDKDGFLFNNRRQSTDSVLRNRILAITAGAKLWMNHYSARQFEEHESIIVDENFLAHAGDADYCFVEDMDIQPYINKVNMVIIFRWNRIYPSDVKFPMDAFKSRWKQIDTSEFSGSTHPVITEEHFIL